MFKKTIIALFAIMLTVSFAAVADAQVRCSNAEEGAASAYAGGQC